MKALIVDDERNMRLMLAELLTGEGYDIVEAGTGEAALQILRGPPDAALDLMLLDLRLPGIGGLDVLDAVREHWPALPVIVLTAHGTIDTAVTCVRRGAFDFLVKPVDVPRLRALVRRVQASTDLVDRAGMSAPRVVPGPEAGAIVGASAGLRGVLETIHKVASTDASVLITGESGTGKELIAQALHQSGTRKEGPFVSINCAALPETLLESELFGFEKGSFTGAHSRKLGQFELANGGTLFLDEIGDMAAPLQAKILRALQERCITRLGGDREIEIDVRVIAATNQELHEAIEQGRFRQDLYYRLNVIPIHLPPLRERREDIDDLVTHFVARAARRHGREAAPFGPEAREALRSHGWPGNVRELENVVEKGVLLGEAAMLEDLRAAPSVRPEAIGASAPGAPAPVRTLREATEAAQRQAIIDAIEHAAGNKRQAAKILDVSYKTLFNKLRDLGLRTRVEVGVSP